MRPGFQEKNYAFVGWTKNLCSQ